MEPIAKRSVKNIVLTHLLLLAFFGSVAFAFAQEGPTTTPRYETKRELSADRQASLQQRTAERQTNLQERVTTLAGNINKRINGTIDRLSKIIDRVHSRIEKMSAAGADVTTAQSHLSIATTNLASAKDLLSSLDPSTISSGTDIKTTWGQRKALYTELHAKLKTVRDEIGLALTSLKEHATAQNI